MRNTGVIVTSDDFLDVPVTGASPSLLEQIGGLTAVERLVDRFVHRTISDRQLAPHFARIDAAALRQSQLAFFSEAFGGTAHLDWSQPAVDLDGDAFSRVVHHLYDALVSFGLPERLNERLVLAVISRALRGSCSGE